MNAQFDLKLENPKVWDELLIESLPIVPNTLTIVTKSNYTTKGKPGLMIAFAVKDANNNPQTVSATLTANSILLLGAFLRGQYPEHFPVELKPQDS